MSDPSSTPGVQSSPLRKLSIIRHCDAAVFSRRSNPRSLAPSAHQREIAMSDKERPPRADSILTDKKNPGRCGVARKRGGQPGNANALKHGRYARKASRRDLARARLNIREEFESDLQVLTESLALAFRLLGDLNNLPEAHRLLFALGDAALSLNKLIRVRALLYPNDPLFLYDLNQALAQIASTGVQTDPAHASQNQS